MPAAGELTPGKRQREANRTSYKPFNHDPKNIGSRTGRPMPQNVRRNSEGLEDINDFFNSPSGTTTAGASTRSVMTNGRGAGASRTPGTARGGSMGNLRGDDEGMGSGEMDMDIDTPETRRRSAANGHRPPPSTSRPQSSRLAPAASPNSFDYDDMTGSRSPTSGRGPSGSRARQSLSKRAASGAVAHDEDEDEEQDHEIVGADDFEDAMASQQFPANPVGRHPTASMGASSRRAGKGLAMAAEDAEEDVDAPLDYGDAAEDDDDEEHGDISMDTTRGRNSGVSARSTKKSARRADVRASADTEDGDPGVPDVGGMGDDVDVGDIGMDLDMDAGMDYGGGEYEGQDGMEGVEGEGEGEEGEEAAPVPRKRGRPKGSGKGKGKENAPPAERKPYAGGAQRNGRAFSVQPIEYEAEDENGYLPRAARHRHKPLDYWRGEHVVYSKDVGAGQRAAVFVPKEVVLIPEEPAKPLASRYKKFGARGRSASAKPGRPVARLPKVEKADENGVNVIGWDQATDPSALTLNFNKPGEEVLRRVAQTAATLKPKAVLNSTFTYQKVFGEDEFFAAGVLNIEVGGCKPLKQSRDNAYVFFVNSGCVEVSIHRSQFIMSEGAHFFIPRGNVYKIENVCAKEVKLFFAQSRKINAEDPDGALEEPAEDNNNVPRPKRKLDEQLAGEEEEEEEEEEEAESDDEPQVPQPRPVAKRGRPAGSGRGGATAATRGIAPKRGRGRPRKE